LLEGAKFRIRRTMKEQLKSGRYQRILLQLEELLPKTEVTTSRMATTSALLHHKMPDFFWTGFYILKNEDLFVGPYQGPLACQMLKRHKGACWAGMLEKRTIIIPDVHKYPGHITCDSRSNSEIVVPLIGKDREPWAVLDVDSRSFGAFNETDRLWLEKISALI